MFSVKNFIGLMLAAGIILAPSRPAAAPPFAITVVQTKTLLNPGADAAITFDAPWGASNHVLLAVMVYSQSVTVDITGITNAEVVLHGPTAHAGNTLNIYLFCWQGDGSDADATIDISAGVGYRTVGVEIAGGSCTEDGTSDSAQLSNIGPHTLSITTSQAGSFLFGAIASSSAADFTAGGTTTGIGVGDATTDVDGLMLGGYEILSGSGSATMTFTSSTSENRLMGVAAVQASGGGGGGGGSTPRQLLMGCCQ